MKTIATLFFSLLFVEAWSQDHFSGIQMSHRTGILNSYANPAVLTAMPNDFEVQLFSFSTAMANNKVGVDDLLGDEDLEKLVFEGSEPVNLRVDVEIIGPGFAFHVNKWTFAVSARGFGKFNLMDIDPNIGDAITNATAEVINDGNTQLNNPFNQRLNGTTWGELNIGVARNIWKKELHEINVGANVRLLFPGSYANIGMNNLVGTISRIGNESYLHSVNNATMNFSYSGNLAESINSSEEYTRSLFGSMNGYGADIGFTYRWRTTKEPNDHRLHTGVSIRNIGSMTFANANNASTNYILNIPQATPLQPGLNLSQFDGIENISEIEQLLIESGYLDRTEPLNKSFTVNLPTTLTLFADVKVADHFFVTFYGNQKLTKDNGNNQVTTQNVWSVTPRLFAKNFELFSTWADNEISGITGGVGMRIMGFFVGSGSALTTMFSNSKQLDLFIGWRMGF